VKANTAALKAIRKAHSNFERSLAAHDKLDKKSFFAYVRSKAKSGISADPLLNLSGKI